MPPTYKPAFIREWRKARGLTLVQLGELAGVDHGNLSKLERGIFPYSQSVLESLAVALGISPVTLLALHPDAVAKLEEELADSEIKNMPHIQEFIENLCK